MPFLYCQYSSMASTILQIKSKVYQNLEDPAASGLTFYSFHFPPFIHWAKPNIALIWGGQAGLFVEVPQLEGVLLFKTLVQNTESSTLTWKSSHKLLG